MILNVYLIERQHLRKIFFRKLINNLLSFGSFEQKANSKVRDASILGIFFHVTFVKFINRSAIYIDQLYPISLVYLKFALGKSKKGFKFVLVFWCNIIGMNFLFQIFLCFSNFLFVLYHLA